MARAHWPLHHGRPIVRVALALAGTRQNLERTLLADTGAGGSQSAFELILPESDCLMCGGNPAHWVVLGGAYAGPFPVYLLHVRVPQIAFDEDIPAVGVPASDPDFDGIAAFGFLNRFSYGNFGDPSQFGLET